MVDGGSDGMGRVDGNARGGSDGDNDGGMNKGTDGMVERERGQIGVDGRREWTRDGWMEGCTTGNTVQI